MSILKFPYGLNPSCERPPKVGALKKERFFGVLFRAPLFLGKWSGVATYFLYKK